MITRDFSRTERERIRQYIHAGTPSTIPANRDEAQRQIDMVATVRQFLEEIYIPALEEYAKSCARVIHGDTRHDANNHREMERFEAKMREAIIYDSPAAKAQRSAEYQAQEAAAGEHAGLARLRQQQQDAFEYVFGNRR